MVAAVVLVAVGLGAAYLLVPDFQSAVNDMVGGAPSDSADDSDAEGAPSVAPGAGQLSGSAAQRVCDGSALLDEMWEQHIVPLEPIFTDAGSPPSEDDQYRHATEIARTSVAVMEGLDGQAFPDGPDALVAVRRSAQEYAQGAIGMKLWLDGGSDGGMGNDNYVDMLSGFAEGRNRLMEAQNELARLNAAGLVPCGS